MRSSAKVIGRGCVDLHAGIARLSLDVTAHPSWRQIVVTWWKSISGSGSGLMTFDGIYCYLRLLLLLSILVSMFWPGQKVKSGHHYFRVFYHQRGKNSLFWPLKGLLFKRCQRCSKHFENLILTEPLTAESSTQLCIWILHRNIDTPDPIYAGSGRDTSQEEELVRECGPWRGQRGGIDGSKYREYQRKHRSSLHIF